MPVSDKDFKDAMGRFPGGVTIVTTVDEDGRRWGFTATAFSSLSLNPPLVLSCLAEKADCKPAFMSAKRFAVNILRSDQQDIAMRFATKGADKFQGDEFDVGETGVPVLPKAVVSVECKMDAIHPGGDHIILIGAVENIILRPGDPLIYLGGKFREAAPLADAAAQKK